MQNLISKFPYIRLDIFCVYVCVFFFLGFSLFAYVENFETMVC